MDKDIARLFELMEQAAIVHHVRMDNRCGWLCSLQRVEHRLQLFVFHFDLLHRLFGNFPALRRDRRHLLADESNRIFGQDRSIDDLLANPNALNVFAGDDGFDARDPQGLADVDSLDPAVRDRASKDLDPKHLGEDDVERVNRPAGDLLLGFNPRSRHAYDSLFCHWVTSVEKSKRRYPLYLSRRFIDKSGETHYKKLTAASMSGRNSAVECQLPKLDVAGSIPVARSNSFKNIQDFQPCLQQIDGGLSGSSMQEAEAAGPRAPLVETLCLKSLASINPVGVEEEIFLH